MKTNIITNDNVQRICLRDMLLEDMSESGWGAAKVIGCEVNLASIDLKHPRLITLNHFPHSYHIIFFSQCCDGFSHICKS